jgi:ribosome-associated protein
MDCLDSLLTHGRAPSARQCHLWGDAPGMDCPAGSCVILGWCAGESCPRVAVPKREIMAIQGEELALACAKAADDIKADDIRVWDMRGISNLTDFMVVCSGTSMPQLRAILRDVAGNVDELHGVKPTMTEGKADTRWVVLDYIDVMVHVMDAELREYYGLEDLWKDAKEVTWQTAAKS